MPSIACTGVPMADRPYWHVEGATDSIACVRLSLATRRESTSDDELPGCGTRSVCNAGEVSSLPV